MVFNKVLTKVFGTSNERAVKRLMPIVAQVNALVIFDATGVVANSSRDYPVPRLDDSDRDFFRHFAHDARAVLE